MTDSGQQELGAFGPGGQDEGADATEGSDGERPEAEAEHVAGNGGGGPAEVVDPEIDTLPDAEGHVELRVTQVDYTIEGYGEDERPIMHVFGRTAEGEAEHVRVRGFEPYFYTPAESVDEGDLATYDRITGYDEVGAEGEPFESIRGDRLWKIYGQTPRDVGQIRDEFDHFEADVLFPNRFLIDKGIQSGVRVPRRRLDTQDGPLVAHHDEVEPVDVQAEARVLTLDIEVNDRNGFPEDGEEPIICLATHDSYDDEYVGWIFEADDGDGVHPETLADYELLDDEYEADVEIRSYETEAAMLDEFLEYVEDRDQDVLTGWNFDDFDMPYLLDRLEEVDPDTDRDLSIERLSRIGEVWRSNWGAPDVKGRVVFDLLYAYERTQFTELDSYKLDDVAETELGVGKERYPGDIGDLWEDDPERLLEYNVRDVELCVELDRKQDIVAFWDEVRTFVGCKLEDATTPGDAVDMYVMQKVHGDFVLPSKGRHEGEDYEGGAVFDPITGVKDMVSVLDLKCFSGDTDVLTPDGSKNIRDVEVGDDVYTMNPDTLECEVKPVAETHQYRNKFGELHHLSGNTHDLKVTENHRFLVSDERGWEGQSPEDFEFAEYREIPDYERFAFPQHEPMDGELPDSFDLVDEVSDGHVVAYSDDDLRVFRNAIPDAVVESLELIHGSSEARGVQKAVGKYLIPLDVFRAHADIIEEHADAVYLKYDTRHRETPTSFEMDNWLELLGWFVTEGSLDRAGGRITIHQEGERDRRAIQDLLEEMAINYNTDERGFNVSNAYLFNWFADNCGEGYADKHLPDWVFDLDADLLTVLLETMIRGDGSRADSGLGKFWTKSDQLKDDAVDLAVRCGHKPTASKQSDGTWYVSIGKRGSFKKADNATVEEHDGDVYCVTAEDNHVVLAGRNGNFQWVGQSLYPMCMVTTNASPETKVDPDAYDGETYRAPNGTHFRKEPNGIIREMVDELLTEREEKKGLRNDHDPDSGEYERFDRQQAAVKVIMNCFTPDTDVLTPEGVRNIRALEVGDEVYSLDPDTMEMETKQVVETHAYPDYRGELVDVQTSKIDFRVTPNHRMLVRKNETNGITQDEWDFVEAGDLDQATNYELPHDWDGPDGEELDEVDLTEFAEEYELWVRPDVHGHTFAAEIGYYPDTVLNNDDGVEGYVFDPEEFEANREYVESIADRTYVHAEPNRKWIPRTFDGDDFLDLVAWYVTEGNVYTTEPKEFGDNYRGSSTTVKIAQERRAVADGGCDHASIGELLDRMGFDYYVDDQAYQFTSKLLGTVLTDRCGGGSGEKRIPDFVFDCSQRQKRRFLETLIDGDGDRQTKSWRFTTSSEQLRDDVLRLCAHLGLTASYGRNSGSWRIYVTEESKNTLRMHRSGSTSTAEDGTYCVTVEDNHTLLAGRNGTFQFVGQSLYGVLGWDRFRLYDQEMGAAVTATGRDVIEFTEEAANEIGHEVTYGDTDSVMLELGDDISVEEAIEESFEIEEHINDAYDDFAREELNAHTHRFQIEFEKLYRRFFQAGKKKRYAGHIVWKEGKEVDDVDITGFEYQRSDIAPVTKEVQHEVIDMIVRGEAVEDVTEYVHGIIEDFKTGAYDPADIGIPGGIGKRLDNYDTDTAQVRGAKYANLLLGTNFARGSKPKRLYIEDVHPDFFRRMEEEEGLDPQQDSLYNEFKRDIQQGDGVICIEYADQLPEEFEIDWEKMLEKTLKGPIERILEALDVSWDEVESGQEQTGLGQFV